MSIPGAGSPLFLSAAAAPAAAFQVDRSLRFNTGDSADLSKTFSSAGNRKTWTWSCWYKRTVLGTKNQKFFSCLTGSDDNTYLELRSFDDDTICLSGYATNFRVTDAEIRDPSAWYHLVVACDTTQSSNSDRVKLYINGVQQTFRTEATITQNADLGFNQAQAHKIGNAFDGYLAEIHFVDGTQLAASDFGEYDNNNNWNPKDCQSSLTYGTNGFYLKFADNSSDVALGTDSSGNSNTWTVNNITANTSALQSQTWSNNFTTTGNSGNWHASFPVTNAFNGNDSNYAHGNADGAVEAAVTLSISPAIPCNSTVTFLGGVTSNGTGTIAINGGTATAFTTVGVNPTASNTATASFSGDITSIVITKTSTSANGLLIYGFEVDGVRLVDSGVAYTAAGDTDSLIDTPTNYTPGSGNAGGNYATLNPLNTYSSTLSNGNLDWSSSTVYGQTQSTIAVSSGKWYYEATITAANNLVGIKDVSVAVPGSAWSGNRAYYSVDGTKFLDGTATSYGASFAAGDVIGVALDMDAGTLVFYKNGASQGTAFTGITGTQALGYLGSNGSAASASVNFGQRPFAYTPPSNHLSLCTTNLADPTIADGSTAMDAVTYSGDGTNGRNITVNHSTDFVWIKSRNQTDNHILADIVRGTDKIIFSHTNIAERSDSTVANSVTAFNSDGFTIGNNANAAQTNQSGFTYVAWSWDGGSSTSSNSDGSITTNVRANASAGFSIIGYTGNATVGATIGHGLNSKPEFFIFKVRSDSGNWYTYHKGYGATKYLTLDRTHSAVANSYLNNTEPTNSVITLSNTFEVNGVNEDLICYAWTSVAGYSSFGSYTGNGSSDGPFIFTGFRPRWILIKDIGGAINWRLLDTARNTFNLAQNGLHPNTAGVENTTNMAMDILSNGFKIKATADINASGNNHIYAAFAEHPFKTSRAR